MSNGRISLRQMKRLLFFDVLGFGMLILPELLARFGGTLGVVALVLGGLIFWGYLQVLSFLLGKVTVGGTLWYGIYGTYLLFASGYALYSLTYLLQEFLLPEKSALLIIVMMLLLLLYGKRGGLETRARVYEVLFWPVIALLIFLLCLGVPGMEWSYVFSASWEQKGMLQGVYLSFLLCSVGQLLCFMPHYIEQGASRRDVTKAGAQGIALGLFFVALIYEVLLGTFGKYALQASRFPIMIFTSNIVIPGGFLRRQEAVLAGVCVVAMLCFIGSGLSYGVTCYQKVKDSWAANFVAVVLLFLLSLGCLQNQAVKHMVEGVLCWGTPVALFLVFFLGRKKQMVCLALAAFVLLGTVGCGATELEDRGFPMILSLGEKDGKCRLRYQYMDLSRVSEKAKGKQGSNALTVTGDSVTGAIWEMEAQCGKQVDLNHLKILLLEESFFKEKDWMAELVQIGNQGTTLPGNMLVYVTKDCGKIEGLQKKMDQDLGTYLEQMAKEKRTGAVSFKNLICHWYQSTGTTLLPVLYPKDDVPVVAAYYLWEKQIETE